MAYLLIDYVLLILLRLQDLQMYLPQLEHYKETNTSITEWIDATRRKQDTLQATKIESIEALQDHINNQKVLCSSLHFILFKSSCNKCYLEIIFIRFVYALLVS